jgi:hypothetical protein
VPKHSTTQRHIIEYKVWVVHENTLQDLQFNLHTVHSKPLRGRYVLQDTLFFSSRIYSGLITVWENLTFITDTRIYSVLLLSLHIAAKSKFCQFRLMPLEYTAYVLPSTKTKSSWVYLCVRVLQCLNRMTDLHEIWYSHYAISCNTNFVICNVRFEVITVVFLEIQVFWDAILYRWIFPDTSNKRIAFIFMVEK